MESVMGVLAMAGGFGLALGMTMLGMNLVLGLMPTKARTVAAKAAPKSE